MHQTALLHDEKWESLNNMRLMMSRSTIVNSVTTRDTKPMKNRTAAFSGSMMRLVCRDAQEFKNKHPPVIILPEEVEVGPNRKKPIHITRTETTEDELFAFDCLKDITTGSMHRCLEKREEMVLYTKLDTEPFYFLPKMN